MCPESQLRPLTHADCIVIQELIDKLGDKDMDARRGRWPLAKLLFASWHQPVGFAQADGHYRADVGGNGVLPFAC